MKVEIAIDIQNMSYSLDDSPFVNSRIKRVLCVTGGSDPTKVVSELIIAMEKAMLETVEKYGN